MNIDGVNHLACLTPMDSLKKGTSRITPLPHMPVLKDLVPDLTGLYAQYELIEPLEGPTTYHEFLAQRGEGLHHLGYYVDDIDTEIARMAALRYPLLQSGRGVWGRRRRRLCLLRQ